MRESESARQVLAFLLLLLRLFLSSARAIVNSYYATHVLVHAIYKRLLSYNALIGALSASRLLVLLPGNRLHATAYESLVQSALRLRAGGGGPSRSYCS